MDSCCCCSLSQSHIDTLWLVNHLLISDRLGEHVPGNLRELEDNEENVRELMKIFKEWCKLRKTALRSIT